MNTTGRLIVEDDAAVSDSLARAIRLAGCEARVTASGMAALDQAERWRVHAVILDLVLPDIDGLEVCRSMRTLASR